MSFNYLDGLSSDTPPQGLEIGNPTLDALGALVDAEDYAGLLETATSLFDQQIFDVRAVIYAIYAEKREEGLLGLPELLDCLKELLVARWEALGPEDKRNRYAKGSLSWLFSRIRVDLQTVELDGSELWQGWLHSLSQEDLKSLQEKFTGLGREIRNILGDELADDPNAKLTEVVTWLGELGPKLLQSNETQEDTDQSDVEEKSSGKGSMGFGTGVTSGSVHLDILMKKLALFEQVMEQGDVAKAAVIVADIMEIIEQFDPRLYLPTLFSRFFSLLTPKIGEIYELMEMRDSPQFQSLTSLYKVDMEAFLNLDINQ